MRSGRPYPGRQYRLSMTHVFHSYFSTIKFHFDLPILHL